MIEGTILQICAANGSTNAVYRDDDGEHKQPVALWALVEEKDGTRGVYGMDAADYVDFCEDMGNFSRYEESGSIFSPGGEKDG